MAEVRYEGSYAAEQTTPLSPAQPMAWRAYDVALALIAIVFFAPFFIAVALAILLDNRGPVLFVQSRVGKDGQSFRCLKFRTMVVDAEARLQALLEDDPVARAEWAVNQKLVKDPRISGVGSFLRRSSLDELPQLFNVISGDMSMVGPRPIVVAEISRYGDHFADYCSVKPGMTGLWQISGRSDLSYDRRVALDAKYSSSKSLILDTKILLLTIPVVLTAAGSY